MEETLASPEAVLDTVLAEELSISTGMTLIYPKAIGFQPAVCSVWIVGAATRKKTQQPLVQLDF